MRIADKSALHSLGMALATAGGMGSTPAGSGWSWHWRALASLAMVTGCCSGWTSADGDKSSCATCGEDEPEIVPGGQ